MAKKAKGGKSGKGGGRPGIRSRQVEAALDPVGTGLLLAAVIAGPSLWSLYSAGNLDLLTALAHGGLVAVGCGLGVNGINRLIADYRVQADRERRVRQMMDALEGVVHEGLALPPVQHPAPHPGAHPPTHPAQLPGPPAPQHPAPRPDGTDPGGHAPG